MKPLTLLCCLILTWLTMAILSLYLLGWVRDPAPKPNRHYAYCFNGKFNLAYPCHENPFWSADL